jgi:hypothetical protein
MRETIVRALRVIGPQPAGRSNRRAGAVETARGEDLWPCPWMSIA